MVHSRLLAEDLALPLGSIQFDPKPAGTVGLKLGKNPVFGLLVACNYKNKIKKIHTKNIHFIV